MDVVVSSPERLSKADGRIHSWLDRFETALTDRRLDDAVDCFAPTCFWRDLVAVTWNITTLEGRDAIRTMLEAQLDAIQPQHFTLSEPATETDGVTEAWINFETEHARGFGHLRLKGEQAWTLLTTARALKNFEEPGGKHRPKGVHHGFEPGRKSWLERRQDEQNSFGDTEQPYCLVVGGGQGGLALGARLRRLGVPALIIDKHARPGQVERITKTGVRFTDGSELQADLIVYATGYGSMNGWAAKLISQDVADAVGKCWGLGSDTTKDPGPWQGELRNMWKPTQQEALWFHGGNLHQSRHYSLYLGLQIKARFEGISTPVYALAKTHHAS